MIREVYLDFIKDKISKRDFKWVYRRSLQYSLIHLSFLIGRPLCGPILGTLVTNYNCNYRCKMCDLPLRDEQLRKKGLKELPTQELKQIIRGFADLGISGIGFTGGEPLLRNDIYELLKYTKDLGMISHLNTNGFLLDKENVAKVIEAGVDSINISLDGSRAATHDAIRGHHGAFDKVVNATGYINALRKEKKSSIRLKIVMVINEANIDEVRELLELSTDLNTDCIEFIPQQPFSGYGDPAVLNYNGTFLGYRKVQKSPTAKIAVSYREAIFLKKLNNAVDYLLQFKGKGVKIENSPRHLRLFEKSFKNEKSPLTCYAGYNCYTLDCYGEVYPCLPWLNWGKPIGNIRDIPLKEFWYSAKFNKIRNNIAKCRDCYLNCQAELNLLFNLRK